MDARTKAVRDRALTLYHRCHDAIDDAGHHYRSIIAAGGRVARGNKCTPEFLVKRISQLAEAANEAWLMHTEYESSMRAPQLAADRLLPPTPDLALGTWSKLYTGKYGRLWGHVKKEL